MLNGSYKKVRFGHFLFVSCKRGISRRREKVQKGKKATLCKLLLYHTPSWIMSSGINLLWRVVSIPSVLDLPLGCVCDGKVELWVIPGELPTPQRVQTWKCAWHSLSASPGKERCQKRKHEHNLDSTAYQGCLFECVCECACPCVSFYVHVLDKQSKEFETFVHTVLSLS